MSDFTFNLDYDAIDRLISTSPKVHAVGMEVCQDLVDEATRVFKNQEVGSDRVSGTSPPKYLDSFVVTREDDTFRVTNTDPGATMVEFGAHAGQQKTPVLKYQPLRRALENLVAKNE